MDGDNAPGPNDPARCGQAEGQDAAAAVLLDDEVDDELVDEVDDEAADVDDDELDESLDELDDESAFLAGVSLAPADFSALTLPERESFR